MSNDKGCATMICGCCGCAAAFNFDGSGAVLACPDCRLQFRFSGNLINPPTVEHAAKKPFLMQQVYGTKKINRALGRLERAQDIMDEAKRSAQVELGTGEYEAAVAELVRERRDASGRDETVKGQTDPNAEVREQLKALREERAAMAREREENRAELDRLRAERAAKPQ